MIQMAMLHISGHFIRNVSTSLPLSYLKFFACVIEPTEESLIPLICSVLSPITCGVFVVHCWLIVYHFFSL